MAQACCERSANGYWSQQGLDCLREECAGDQASSAKDGCPVLRGPGRAGWVERLKDERRCGPSEQFRSDIEP